MSEVAKGLSKFERTYVSNTVFDAAVKSAQKTDSVTDTLHDEMACGWVNYCNNTCAALLKDIESLKGTELKKVNLFMLPEIAAVEQAIAFLFSMGNDRRVEDGQLMECVSALVFISLKDTILRVINAYAGDDHSVIEGCLSTIQKGVREKLDKYEGKGHLNEIISDEYLTRYLKRSVGTGNANVGEMMDSLDPVATQMLLLMLWQKQDEKYPTSAGGKKKFTENVSVEFSDASDEERLEAIETAKMIIELMTDGDQLSEEGRSYIYKRLFDVIYRVTDYYKDKSVNTILMALNQEWSETYHFQLFDEEFNETSATKSKYYVEVNDDGSEEFMIESDESDIDFDMEDDWYDEEPEEKTSSREKVGLSSKRLSDMRFDDRDQIMITMLYALGNSQNREDKQLMDMTLLMVLVSLKLNFCQIIYRSVSQARRNAIALQNGLSEIVQRVSLYLPRYNGREALMTYFSYFRFAVGLQEVQEEANGGWHTKAHERSARREIEKAIAVLKEKGILDPDDVQVGHQVRAQAKLKLEPDIIHKYRMSKPTFSYIDDEEQQIQIRDEHGLSVEEEATNEYQYYRLHTAISKMNPVARFIYQTKLEYLKNNPGKSYMSMSLLKKIVMEKFPSIKEVDVMRFDNDAATMIRNMWEEEDYQDELVLSGMSKKEMKEEADLISLAVGADDGITDFFD